ncbi:hypothetical protein HDV05_008815 [Chytridiales sp. JEL 0842]|nr:hypothetical protein HDV05_008815 [Chytridiales sp. JEL 0842]
MFGRRSVPNPPPAPISTNHPHPVEHQDSTPLVSTPEEDDRISIHFATPSTLRRSAGRMGSMGRQSSISNWFSESYRDLDQQGLARRHERGVSGGSASGSGSLEFGGRSVSTESKEPRKVGSLDSLIERERDKEMDGELDSVRENAETHSQRSPIRGSMKVDEAPVSSRTPGETGETPNSTPNPDFIAASSSSTSAFPNASTSFHTPIGTIDVPSSLTSPDDIPGSGHTTVQGSASPQSKMEYVIEDDDDSRTVEAFRAQVRRLRGQDDNDHDSEESGSSEEASDADDEASSHHRVHINSDEDSNPQSPAKSRRRRRRRRSTRNRHDSTPQTPSTPNIKGSTPLQAILNASNVMLGMSILSLPYAISMSGWILGLCMLTIFTLTVTRTAKLVAKCMEARAPEQRVFGWNASSEGLDERTALLARARRGGNVPATYAEIGDMAFGNPGRRIITTLFTLELLAASTASLVVAADSIVALFPSLSLLAVKLALTSIFALTTWPNNLSLLSYSSMVGVLALFSVFGVLLVNGFGTTHGPGSIWDPRETALWPTSFVGLGLSVGMFVVGLDDLKEQKDFPKVINWTYLMIFVLYVGFGGLGYLMFGGSIMPEITQNFPTIPTYNPALTQFVLVLTAINPLTKYSLIMSPVNYTIESALSIPHATVIFPVVCYLRLYGGSLTVLDKLGCWAMLVGGTILGVCGTLASFMPDH